MNSKIIESTRIPYPIYNVFFIFPSLMHFSFHALKDIEKPSNSVLVSLIQLLGTMHNICKARYLNIRHH